MSNSSDESIRAALAAEGIENEITCAKAQGICKKYDIDPSSLGVYCSSMHIKIRRCMFGCFK
ncbi:hypothetical protein [Methanorbis rubei]